MGSDLSRERLKLNRRLIRYRGYADEALREAARCRDPDARRACLSMAAQWSALASELDNVAKEFDALESGTAEETPSAFQRLGRVHSLPRR